MKYILRKFITHAAFVALIIGGSLYAKHEYRRWHWLNVGIGVLCAPTAIVIVLSSLVLTPIASLINPTPAVSIGPIASMGTGFLSGFIVVATSLCLVVQILDRQIDRMHVPSHDELREAQHGLEKYYTPTNIAIAYAKLFGFCIFGAWAMVKLMLTW